MAYAYSALSSGGMEIKEYNTGGTGSLAAWIAKSTDMLGRPVSESQSITASTAVTTSTTGYYLSTHSGQSGYFFGSPRFSENGDSVRSFYRYNSLGETVEETLDLNGNDILDNTVDRRTLYARAYIDGSAAGLYPAILRETTTSLVMPDNTTQAVSRTRSSADGDWRDTATHPVSGVFATVGSFARTWNATTPGTWTEEEELPDNTSRIRSYIGGRLSSETAKDDNSAVVTSTSWTYDGVGRIRTTTDGRTGTTTIASYTAMDLPSQVTDPGARTTTYTYDNLGNLTEIGFPSLLTQSRTYYAVGPLKRQYGTRTYDVSYAYNSYGGRMTAMTTKFGSGGTDSTTTWIYDNYRPELLGAKIFGDGGDESYSYSAGGRLTQRAGFSTPQVYYGYYLSGEFRSINYSSGTPDVLFIYDRIGRVVRVEDGTLNGGATAMTSLRYAYDYDWDLQPDLLLSETVEGLHSGGSGIEDKVLTRLRQSTTNAATNQVRYRDKGFMVAGSGGEEYRVEYGFDNAGRLAIVANDGETYTYAYEANSNLVRSMTAGYYKTTRTWESTRDVLASISNTNLTGSSVLSRYTYSVDDIGRRTDIVRDGAAFATAHFDKIGYNAADEVVSSDRFAGTNPAQTGTAIPGHEYDWTYDATGNRLTSVINGTTTSYTPAAGNQYSAVTGYTPAYYDRGNLVQDANFVCTWDDENRCVTRTPLSPATNDLKYTYEYDYAGRRIKSVSDYWTGSAWAHFHTETFLYDGWNPVCTYSRCLTGSVGWKRREWTWGLDLSGTIHGAGGVGGLLKAKGWLVPDSTLSNHYSYNYLYDGNGNVTGIMGPAWGASLGAKCEYDAFGRTVVSAFGPVGALTFAFMNPYRFSTEHWDMASRSDSQGHNSGGWNKRLYYYGHRYYDPVTGRWLSRDPIGEEGGVNLYGLVGNDAVNRWDFLGLAERAYYKSYQEAAEACGAMAKTAALNDQKARLDAENAENIRRKRPLSKMVPQEYEFGGRVCKSCKEKDKDAPYYCTRIIKSAKPNEINPNYTQICDPKDEYAGFFHSHPGNKAGISEADRDLARKGFGAPDQTGTDKDKRDTREETRRKPVVATSGDGKGGFSHDHFPPLKPK